jgi:transposase InsO family protein
LGPSSSTIAIDDHSRIAFTAMYPNQKEGSASHFLTAAMAWFQSLGIQTTRILTDNGPCYNANRFRQAWIFRPPRFRSSICATRSPMRNLNPF